MIIRRSEIAANLRHKQATNDGWDALNFAPEQVLLGAQPSLFIA